MQPDLGRRGLDQPEVGEFAHGFGDGLGVALHDVPMTLAKRWLIGQVVGRHGTPHGRSVSGTRMRIVMLSGTSWPMRILSRGSCKTPCNVLPEKPEKSMETFGCSKARSICGRSATARVVRSRT